MHCRGTRSLGPTFNSIPIPIRIPIRIPIPNPQTETPEPMAVAMANPKSILIAHCVGVACNGL